ncbi:MAG: hypothetical protein PHV07_03985, partial [Oscillospiraceae bacterium]|nr:hypothetical protein [Oscillospiraceae bacterium]
MYKDSDMKFRTLLLSSVFSMAMIGSAVAASYSVTGDGTLSGEYNNNVGAGVVAGISNPSSNAGNPWVLEVTGNVSAKYNLSMGLHNREDTSSLEIRNSSNNHFLLDTSENYNNYTLGDVSDNAYGIIAKGYMSIYGMNINSSNNISQNRTAFGLINTGELNITGFADGSNKITLNGNEGAERGVGISNLNDGTQASLRIENVDIETSNNSFVGTQSTFGAKMNIIGIADGTNIIQANSNGVTKDGKGLYVNSAGSEINIENMNVQANGNGLYGVEVYGGGKLDITGIADGTNILQAKNNKNTAGTAGSGIYTGGTNSKVNIENMSVDLSENESHNLYVEGLSSLDITGIENSNHYLAADNSVIGIGVYGRNGAEVNIKYMDVQLNGNKSNGMLSENATIKIIGAANGTNWLSANDTINNNGIYSLGTSEITIDNMNVQANRNGLHGVVGLNGGKVDITGIANGSNWIQANNNINAAGDNGRGIYSSGTGSEILINNMDIEANNNFNGVNSSNGGYIKMEGSTNTTNKLTTNNNSNDDRTNGGGISAASDSKLEIINMDIESSYNGSRNFASYGGGIINIMGSSNRNTLVTEMSESGVAIATGGVGSSGNASEMNIENMNIYERGDALVLVRDEAILNLTNSDVYMQTGDKILISDGDATFNLDGVDFHGNSSIFLETTSTSGTPANVDVNVANSEIMGSMATDTGLGASSDINLDNTVWRSVGRSNVSNLSL